MIVFLTCKYHPAITLLWPPSSPLWMAKPSAASVLSLPAATGNDIRMPLPEVLRVVTGMGGKPMLHARLYIKEEMRRPKRLWEGAWFLPQERARATGVRSLKPDTVPSKTATVWVETDGMATPPPPTSSLPGECDHLAQSGILPQHLILWFLSTCHAILIQKYPGHCDSFVGLQLPPPPWFVLLLLGGSHLISAPYFRAKE